MTSILVCLLVLSNILVNVKPTEISPLANDCTSSTSSYIEGSKFPLNLNDLLYRSLCNSGGNSIYGKVSVEEDTDKVHGVYLCRGVIAPKDCQKYCIDVASLTGAHFIDSFIADKAFHRQNKLRGFGIQCFIT
ncbi:hypothetical protein P3S68_031336 [Capsicum galapagoense]